MNKAGKSFIVALTLYWAIFSIHVPILGFGGSADGSTIRIDDILVFLSVILVTRVNYDTAVSLPRYVILFFFYVAISLASTITNWALGRIELLPGLLFTFRHVEYFCFFFFGANFFRSGYSFGRLAIFYVWYSAFIIALQSFELLPSANGFSLSRFSSNTNGPYEFAVVIAFSALIAAAEPYHKKSNISIITAIFLLVGSASRITIVGTFIAYIYRTIIYKSSSVRSIAAILVGAVIIGAGYFLLNIDSEMLADTPFDRFVSLENNSNVLEESSRLTQGASVVHTSKEYIDTYFVDSLELGRDVTGDKSSFLRFFRWTILIKSVLSDSSAIALGLGPSFGTSAVDGNYVRIVVETGFLGAFVFALFLISLFRSMWRKSHTIVEMLIVLCVTAAFIDIFVSFKPMAMFWSYLGYCRARSIKDARANLAENI